jgi:hypothetical protein
LTVTTDPELCAVIRIILALCSDFGIGQRRCRAQGQNHFFVALHIFALYLFLANATVFAGLTLGAAAACKCMALGLLAINGSAQLVWLFLVRPDFWRAAGRAFQVLAPAIFFFLYGVDILLQTLLMTTVVSIWSRLTKHQLFQSLNLLMQIIHWTIGMNRIQMLSDIPNPFESEPIN